MDKGGLPRRGALGSWSNLQFLLAVARLGSFLKAAQILETNQSTVARRIQRLETDLGTKIFDRHAHGMELTPAGQVLFEKALAIEKVTCEISAQLSGLDTEPTGTVRIAAPEGLGYLWLAPAISEFCDMYRDIDVEVVTNREGADLLARESDIAFSLNRPTESRLVVSRVAQLRMSLFLSQKYAAKIGLPTCRSELTNHEFCEYTSYRSNAELNSWLDSFLLNQRVRFRTNSASVYLASIRGGTGIGLLPFFYKYAASDLLELAIDTDCTTTLWMMSHEETNKARRTRLLLSFLMERYARDRSLWFEPSANTRAAKTRFEREGASQS